MGLLEVYIRLGDRTSAHASRLYEEINIAGHELGFLFAREIMLYSNHVHLGLRKYTWDH